MFLPFLVIKHGGGVDLMSMGVMMLPPTINSLPSKIIFFVLVDGWYLVAVSLVHCFGRG